MLENENDWLKCLSFLLVTDPVWSAHVIIHSCTFSGYIIKVLVLIINSADIPLNCFTVLWYFQPLRIPLPVVAHCIRVFYICRILAKWSNKMLPDHLKYVRLFKSCYVPHFVSFYLTCFTELWVQVNKSIAIFSKYFKTVMFCLVYKRKKNVYYVLPWQRCYSLSIPADSELSSYWKSLWEWMHHPVLIVTDSTEGAIINSVEWQIEMVFELVKSRTGRQTPFFLSPPHPHKASGRCFVFMARIVGHPLAVDEQWQR